MAQTIWTGAISFGLVSIPVKLFTAVSSKDVSFHQFERSTGARIRYRKVSQATGDEVAPGEIVKGYELSDGRHVTFEDDELDALDPRASRSIDLLGFVDLAEIDPIYFDRPYYLAPADQAKPYALLTTALEASRRVAIGRFVMRSKEHLCAVRSQAGHLLLSTMVYADEIVDPAAVPDLDRTEPTELTDAELAMADQLIGSLSMAFEPERFHDTHRERVIELIDRKAAGDAITPPSDPGDGDGDDVVDLMEALEASVAAAKETRAIADEGSAASV
jgi:DNA end-binding protein Ku